MELMIDYYIANVNYLYSYIYTAVENQRTSEGQDDTGKGNDRDRCHRTSEFTGRSQCSREIG